MSQISDEYVTEEIGRSGMIVILTLNYTIDVHKFYFQPL